MDNDHLNIVMNKLDKKIKYWENDNKDNLEKISQLEIKIDELEENEIQTNKAHKLQLI